MTKKTEYNDTAEPAVLRCAIYERVSTPKQAKDGFSLENQSDRLRKFAELNGWKVVAEFVDAGRTGRNTKRPEYQKMMSRLDKFDIVLCYKFDRIHRNTRNFGEMLDIFKKHGKKFVAMADGIDTNTVMGRFVADIIARLAQLESEQTGARVSETNEYLAEGPRWMGPAGFGYTKDAEHRLVPFEPEAQWVGRIFEWYASGMSMADIAQGLNDLEVKPSKRSKRQPKWVKGRVKLVLTDIKYLGHRRGKGGKKQYDKDNTHAALVDQVAWDEVQKRLFKNRELHRPNRWRSDEDGASDQDDPAAAPAVVGGDAPAAGAGVC